MNKRAANSWPIRIDVLTFILTVAVIMNVYRELREGSSSIIHTTATELSKAC